MWVCWNVHLYKIFVYNLEMGSLTKKPTFFGFTSWNLIKIFYETEIIQFSAITTEWQYPRKHCWKRLSDFAPQK